MKIISNTIAWILDHMTVVILMISIFIFALFMNFKIDEKADIACREVSSKEHCDLIQALRRRR